MMSFTADGQLDPELCANRDKICNVDSGARGRVRFATFRGQVSCQHLVRHRHTGEQASENLQMQVLCCARADQHQLWSQS